MPYDPNKPGPNDLLSNSQLDIQSNFQTANTVMNVNHYPFDNVSGNQGKHKFVEMPVLAVKPAGLAASEATLYSKTVSGTSQLFIVPGTSANEFQLTSMNNADFGTFGTSPDGWSFFPGGLIVNWGTATKATDGAVTYSRNFTGDPYIVQLTTFENTNSRNFLWVKTKTSANFTVSARDSAGQDTPITFTWWALGFA